MYFVKGDHLISPRLGYTHHGIYITEGYVVENSQKGTNLVSLEEFSQGKGVYILSRPDRVFSREETVQKALLHVGEHKYNVITYNCEHFVNLCIIGKAKSKQVKDTAANIAGMCFVAAETVSKIYKASKNPYVKKVSDKALDAASIATGTYTAVKVIKTAFNIADKISTAKNLADTIKEGHADLKTAIKIAFVTAGFDLDLSDKIASKVDSRIKKVFKKDKTTPSL